MKLKTLAIAVAMASVPFAAQADFTVGGDVTVSYFKDGKGATGFGGKGSEVTFDASEKVGNTTFFGHFEVNVADQVINSTASVDAGGANEETITVGAGTLKSSDMYVGARGAFGEVRLGNTDNGCDATDVGGVLPDVFVASGSGGCAASDNNNITYRKTAGTVTYAASFSPDVDSGSAEEGETVFAVGVKGSVGPATMSLGYEDGSSSNVVLGAEGSFGPLTVGLRANKAEDIDTVWGVSAAYVAGNNTIYAGYGEDDDSVMLGYQRAYGKNTILVVEALDADGQDNVHYALGMKHSF